MSYRVAAAIIKCVLCVATVLLALAGCRSATLSSADSVPSTQSAATTEMSRGGPPTTPADAPATGAHGYRITAITAPGSQPGGYLTIPQLSGGDPEVTARFNAAMKASRAAMPEQSPSMSVDDGEVEGIASGVTRIGSGAVAGRIVLLWYGHGAAHPNNSLGTVVIATRTATPITVEDLYVDREAARARLRTLLPQLDPTGRLDARSASGDDVDANWLPTSTGLQIYVPVAHVLGDYVPVLVRWDRIADLLQPGMLELLRAD